MALHARLARKWLDQFYAVPAFNIEPPNPESTASCQLMLRWPKLAPDQCSTANRKRESVTTLTTMRWLDMPRIEISAQLAYAAEHDDPDLKEDDTWLLITWIMNTESGILGKIQNFLSSYGLNMSYWPKKGAESAAALSSSVTAPNTTTLKKKASKQKHNNVASSSAH
ncbi:uncharacterized protein N7496_001956 [Penicillium cataractarum]|uniref:Uncharacterized protein n=1 Tax=Penicillium cataractarum TaxID=2100454 RepID=A0A9X0B7E6_9EURO|nr:uncharacterized protein N7496_001956 [Penicillium cataractarum]KAJ5390888.1 hypothetical protein N7496_001956 [Penicillium cataractarum]